MERFPLRLERDESFFKYHSCFPENFLCCVNIKNLTMSCSLTDPPSSRRKMPYDDYSDSDDESNTEEIQTNVLLGLPDGPVSTPSDLLRPRISRIGGLPVYTFLYDQSKIMSIGSQHHSDWCLPSFDSYRIHQGLSRRCSAALRGGDGLFNVFEADGTFDSTLVPS